MGKLDINWKRPWHLNYGMKYNSCKKLLILTDTTSKIFEKLFKTKIQTEKLRKLSKS
jgi:hypothetical protein